MNYPENFETLWGLYPRRIGNNPKRKAYNAYNARVKQGYDHNSMINGLKRYCVFCEKTGIINTSYVMHASTFLGLDENFLEEWEPPEIKQEWEKMPSDNEKLWDWANKHNFSGPGSLTYYQYRGVLQKEVEKRIAQAK